MATHCQTLGTGRLLVYLHTSTRQGHGWRGDHCHETKVRHITLIKWRGRRVEGGTPDLFSFVECDGVCELNQALGCQPDVLGKVVVVVVVVVGGGGG
jgi:hypothetical protein